MENRRVKKPRSLKWLLTAYFLQTAANCVVLLLLWWMGMTMMIRWLVYPAGTTQAAAAASSEAILASGAFSPALVDPLCPYIVFDSEGEVLQTDMDPGEQDMAQSNYQGGSMQNGLFYPKFYTHTRLENGQTVLLQYDFRLQYRDPAWRGLPDFQVCYILLLLSAGLFTVLLHTWLFARRLEKSIRKIVNAGAQIADNQLEEGDFSSTGVKELDGAMHAMDKLRKSLAASLKEQWAQQQQRQIQMAALAHDLKTPLAVISGNTELLLEEAPQGRAREELETILRNTEHARDYLGQLAGAACGAVASPPVQLQLQPFLRELEAAVQALCAKKRIDFTLENTGSACIMASGEPLRRALLNLLDNAVRYAPQGGWVRLVVQDENEGMAFAVQDNGPGFSTQALRCAAQLLFTEDASRARQGHFGFGLAYAAEAARTAGGRLDLQNLTGAGAEAVLWLPQK